MTLLLFGIPDVIYLCERFQLVGICAFCTAELSGLQQVLFSRTPGKVVPNREHVFGQSCCFQDRDTSHGPVKGTIWVIAQTTKPVVS